MHDLLRLPIYQRCLAFNLIFACCLALVQVSLMAQALPNNTPPLNNPAPAYPSTFPASPSANDARYGRVGTSPDAAVGRDRMYRGLTPANDASFTRYGRSTMTRPSAAAALGKFASKFGPVGTVLALKDLADDLSGQWQPTVDGYDLVVPRQTGTCVPPAGIETALGQARNRCSDGEFPSSVELGISVLQRPNVCAIKRQCVTRYEEPFTWSQQLDTQQVPLTRRELEDAIALSPRLPELTRQIDLSPEMQRLPVADRLPWSAERVILPPAIDLPPVERINPDRSVTRTRTRLTPRDDGSGGIVWDRRETIETDAPPNTGTNPSPVTVTTPIGTTTSPEKLPEKDPCEKNPSRLGCIELGQGDGEIPKSQKNITYEPENVFGGGSCPADRYIDIRGQSIKAWDFAQTCNLATTYIKPIIIALASFAAFLIVSGVRVDS
jgi:hypothetical protein